MKHFTVAPVFHYYADNVHWQTNYSDGSSFGATVTTAHTTLRLFTGGRAGIGRMSLIQLQCSGLEYGRPDDGSWSWPWLGMEMTTIDPSTMRAFGQPVGADGNLWVMEPDNAALDLNLTAPGEHYGAWVTPTKYELVHQTLYPALTDTNLARLNLGVGEDVAFGFTPQVPTNVMWTTTAGSLTNDLGTWTDSAGETIYNSQHFIAPSNAAPNVAVTATVPMVVQPFTTSFSVVEPSGVDHALINYTGCTDSPPYIATNDAGAAMYLNVWMAPKYVSFYRVQILEIGEDATNFTGYFANTNLWTTNPASRLHHYPGDWIFLTESNSWIGGDGCWTPHPDGVSDPGYLPQLPTGGWSTGSYTWNIPAGWRVAGQSITNPVANGWQQVFTIDVNGTATITKFINQTVIRTTNNVNTPCL